MFTSLNIHRTHSKLSNPGNLLIIRRFVYSCCCFFMVGAEVWRKRITTFIHLFSLSFVTKDYILVTPVSDINSHGKLKELYFVILNSNTKTKNIDSFYS